MSKPVKPVVPPPALRSEPDTFKDRAEANIEFFEPLVEYMDDVADFVDEQADAAVAAAQAGDLPPIAGKAGQLLKVNAVGTGLDFQQVQSGVMDTAANRLLVSGAYGWGRTEGYAISDADVTSRANGAYRVNPTTAGLPIAAYGTLLLMHINSENLTQIYHASTENALYYRSNDGGGWEPWSKVFGSDDIASQPEAEAGADNTKVMTPLGTKQSVVANQAVKAWVNFNGTGSVAILDSHNVSSITDNGTGDYTINFATALESANYAFVGSCSSSGGEVLALCLQGGYSSAPTLKTASQVRLHALNAPFRSAADAQNASVIIVQ